VTPGGEFVVEELIVQVITLRQLYELATRVAE
jgi:hypothetical protein